MKEVMMRVGKSKVRKRKTRKKNKGGGYETDKVWRTGNKLEQGTNRKRTDRNGIKNKHSINCLTVD